MKKKEIANQVARDSMYSEAGKGDSPRPTDQQKYEEGYDRIFGKKSKTAPPKEEHEND
jgi:hypothetical protein